ncbi:hypothetical protein KUCAC02_003291 [Chaenocephalus aceratus]|uniref:Uncharacterized protein n=1 Tax=Chaenocephalus aceratus TaxID=36190 RepID=A0ACB9WLX5_CHAAC|nr:hypothetical protein KUCAC02_003291 [Chaenocephalus aceratus]
MGKLLRSKVNLQTTNLMRVTQGTRMGASQNEEPAANHAPLMEERIISKLSTTIDRHDQTIQGLEVALKGMETRLQAVESTCTALSGENESLKFKVDNLENRSRRNNIRITGVPEKVEGPQPTAFMELFLAETCGAEAFPSPPAVDRAHRVATARKTQSDTPRPFIARIHNFQTKERILKLAREASPLSLRGGNIHFPGLQCGGIKEESHIRRGQIGAEKCGARIQDVFSCQTPGH